VFMCVLHARVCVCTPDMFNFREQENGAQNFAFLSTFRLKKRVILLSQKTIACLVAVVERNTITHVFTQCFLFQIAFNQIGVCPVV
jgi:hypothetical protein